MCGREKRVHTKLRRAFAQKHTKREMRPERIRKVGKRAESRDRSGAGT